MKNNKKGFTLIELLAVIVILAIIMVIAVPQILNVINDSRKKSWDNSMKLVGEAVELAITTSSFGSDNFTLTTCTDETTCADMQTKIFDRADITTDDYVLKSISKDSNGNYVITMDAKAGGQFASISDYINDSTKPHNTVTINAGSIN